MSPKRNARPVPPVLRVRFNYNVARELGVTAIEAAHVGELANGLTQDEIAHRYRTNVDVISTRIWRLRKRMRLRTTAQLISWAHEHGVLEVPARAKESKENNGA